MSKAIGLNYPRELPDAELSGRVLATLARSGQVKSDDLRVFVEDGVVTLLGTVDTPYESRQACRLTRGLDGVRRVDNRLTVAIEQYLSDAELLARVQARLSALPLFARHPIGARIQRGVVTLLGRVDSLVEQRAARDAAEQVKGVRQVVSALKVGRIDPTDQPVAIVDDTLLLSRVNAAVADAGVTIYQNRSYVRDGVAHLRGLVLDRRAMRRALLAAQRVDGVQGVRNELALHADPASRDPDEALAGRVVGALHDDGRVSPSQVTPVAAGGVVDLAGQVDSIEDHDAALAVTAHVAGVHEVVDNVRILGRSPLRATDRRGGRLQRVRYRHQGK